MDLIPSDDTITIIFGTLLKRVQIMEGDKTQITPVAMLSFHSPSVEIK